MTSERESSANVPSPPSFEEWVEYCFVHGQRDFYRTSKDSPEIVELREARFLRMDETLLIEHLTRLFENPAFIADRYTDDQIAEATWFIFGCGSDLLAFRNSKVAPELQARCIRSVATMYTDLFDRVCGRRGTDLETELHGEKGIDCAVYMIWDMDHIESSVMRPELWPHLVEPGIGVLETVLTKCRTSACLISALHGIGHIYGYLTRQGHTEKTITARLQSIVDSFLKNRSMPDWLREYALEAREGHVN